MLFPNTSFHGKTPSTLSHNLSYFLQGKQAAAELCYPASYWISPIPCQLLNSSHTLPAIEFLPYPSSCWILHIPCRLLNSSHTLPATEFLKYPASYWIPHVPCQLLNSLHHSNFHRTSPAVFHYGHGLHDTHTCNPQPPSPSSQLKIPNILKLGFCSTFFCFLFSFFWISPRCTTGLTKQPALKGEEKSRPSEPSWRR